MSQGVADSYHITVSERLAWYRFSNQTGFVTYNKSVGVIRDYLDSKFHWANMGPSSVLSAPDGPHEPCYQGYFLCTIHLVPPFLHLSDTMNLWQNLVWYNDGHATTHDDVTKMVTFSALLALCTGNSPVTGEFPAQMASNAELWFVLWSASE